MKGMLIWIRTIAYVVVSIALVIVIFEDR